jgi:hypothetical protein
MNEMQAGKQARPLIIFACENYVFIIKIVVLEVAIVEIFMS